MQDRVETSPEQMAACSALAEHMSVSTGMPTRVVGWYHSHPHITVLPSHVDVNTQVCLQMCVCVLVLGAGEAYMPRDPQQCLGVGNAYLAC